MPTQTMDPPQLSANILNLAAVMYLNLAVAATCLLLAQVPTFLAVSYIKEATLLFLVVVLSSFCYVWFLLCRGQCLLCLGFVISSVYYV